MPSKTFVPSWRKSEGGGGGDRTVTVGAAGLIPEIKYAYEGEKMTYEHEVSFAYEDGHEDSDLD